MIKIINLTIDDMRVIVGSAKEWAEFFVISGEYKGWFGNKDGVCVDGFFTDRVDVSGVSVSLAEMRAAIASHDSQEQEAVCAWASDDEGNYDTACGNRFEFGDGLPSNFKYCCYCGKGLGVRA